MARAFQQQAPRSHREGGLGSGVIISPDGYILTNNHVVDGATDVRVTLPDRREFKATVIGTDARTDIALVKIDASNLPAITVGNSSKLQVGDAVLAIGNPYGVGQTVTMGIVSATGRSDLGIEEYEDFIQTDAPINPGNSGGALVNDRGELIGINTAILAQESGGNQGIGFAVPVNLARQVMDQIETHGHVTRAYLGVNIQEVTPAIAKASRPQRTGRRVDHLCFSRQPRRESRIESRRRDSRHQWRQGLGEESAPHAGVADEPRPEREAEGLPQWPECGPDGAAERNAGRKGG